MKLMGHITLCWYWSYGYRLAREYAVDNKHPYSDKITRIQTMLVDISADIMKIPSLGDNHDSKQEEKSLITSCNTKELEEWIEEYSKHLPPLENHILPVCSHFYNSFRASSSRCIISWVKECQIHSHFHIMLLLWIKYIHRLTVP